ncbi:hypothetical protein ACQEVZ_60605 [Dactylosporangium sp. CA-152071]|uniref:hypothetical protein n=1 Tax=Dactylosporangium sp. CA-152071 TaxID=3239933 RepID=UPI003D916FFC
MTTLREPAAGPALFDWRDQMLRPPNVELVIGPMQLACPIDDVILLPRTGGWYCPTCFGGWNSDGRGGQWLAIRNTVLRTAQERQERHLRLVPADLDDTGDTGDIDDIDDGIDVDGGGDQVDVVDARAAAAARLRRIDRITAASVAGGVLVAGAVELGRRLPQGLVPEQALWTAIAVVGGAEAAAVVVVLLLNRVAARRAAAVGELVDEDLGEDFDGGDAGRCPDGA